MSKGLQVVERAVLKTLLYADIFDFPLTPREIHHYLIECRASPASVEAGLETLSALGYLERANGYVAIAGRAELFEIRRDRAMRSARLWPHARRWGIRLAALPFVRMVAVTGALAVNNVGERSDIDYLLVTAPGRLWISRALAVAMVRAAALRDILLCPNYLITTRRLHFEEHNLFTAHDLTQMVPLYGQAVYQALWEQNPWWEPYLPQARGPVTPAHPVELPGHIRRLKRLVERSLESRVGNALDAWERNRKARKFQQQALDGRSQVDGLVFDHDVCKGHFEGHGRRTLEAYQARLRQYGLDDEEPSQRGTETVSAPRNAAA